jgi:hypothetical protein
MKFVLAPDSFKESMSASQAVAAMRSGILSVIPEAHCIAVPMADGGEGTVDAVVDALDGRRIKVEVQDALGRTTTATYGHIPHRQLAVIEIAAAAGLELIAADERDILRASTFGVGQLIKSALDQGANDILIGLGGSATNDGGVGMLLASWRCSIPRLHRSTGGILGRARECSPWDCPRRRSSVARRRPGASRRTLTFLPGAGDRPDLGVSAGRTVQAGVSLPA